MVILDKMADLGSDLGAIPSHNQHLPNGPEPQSVSDPLVQ